MKQVLVNIFALLFSFYCVSQTITSAEYFYNTDPGVGNGTTLAVNSNTGQLTQTFTLPTVSLPEGFNSLYIRTLNNDGNWSLYDRQNFYLKNFTNTAISAVEYFFDTDPSVGNGTPLAVDSNSGQLTQIFTITTTGLSQGFHSFYLRTKSNDDNWSLYDRQIIYIKDFDFSPDEVSSAEYFIDSDPGIGNGTLIVFSNPSQSTQILNIDSTDLAEGDHLFYVRVQDANGDWSIYDTALFTIDSSLEVEDSLFKSTRIYPNPFVKSIEISSSKNLSFQKVNVYDFEGRKVYESKSNLNKIDLEFLSQGVYILQLKSNNSEASFKIIKK